MNALISELKDYSSEWKFLIEEFDPFRPKCEYTGVCNEKDSCGRKERSTKSNKDIDYVQLLVE